MIKADSIHKQFGEIKAVNGISFDIERGEVFGLLGPNGAGKTTTISMLTGLLHPDSGHIYLQGSPDPTQPLIRKKVGVVPQSLAIYDELTAEENLHFFGSLYQLGSTKLKERIEWSLKLSGLVDRCKDRVKTFSGGMKRRLNLACGLIHDPPILLLDEPTVGIDPQSRNMIFEQIEKLKDDGRTLIYTTHYMEEAERLCDRVAIIDNGQILALDTVSGLIDKHAGKSVVRAVLIKSPSNEITLPAQPDGLHLRFETDSPVEVIARLTNNGVEFRSVHIDQADLETVFLNLTGRSLRD